MIQKDKLGNVKKTRNRHAFAMSKLGASKGGRASMAKLSPDERKAFARRAARIRWSKKKSVDKGNGTVV